MAPHKLYHTLLTVAVLLSAAACRTSYDLAEHLIAPGVSKSLAEWRKATLSDVRYDLHFNIPDSDVDIITGEVTIRTNMEEPVPMVVDFRSDYRDIVTVIVNDRLCNEYSYEDEHIIIPTSHLTKGENKVGIKFNVNNKPLNRNREYVYTLLVPDRARTLFPCFDQPDIKATYNLSLELPREWVAVANSPIAGDTIRSGRRVVNFAATEPLSTYLFSFVAGRFHKQTRSDGHRTISAYYRESNPDKVKQLDEIFRQVFAALDWQEDYTGIPYPFAKYDFIILPGFQFGGMEHTGATLYNDRVMFLGNEPTLDEQLRRAQLIAHETSHMWFGDLVTMQWFDDVWTKEVFANYFAEVITRPDFPEVNHDMNRLFSFYATSMKEDRTDGTTAIQQPLDNLRYAGLVYNNIIYNKAPVMMFKLNEIMGEESFRRGIRNYLSTYAYDNATWDGLIDILDAETDADLKEFSRVWVKETGMPTITCRATGRKLRVEQTDPAGKGRIWPQSFTVEVTNGDRHATIPVTIDQAVTEYDLPFEANVAIPNSDGHGYAYFALDEASADHLLNNWQSITDEVTRVSAVMTLNENYLHYNLRNDSEVLHSLLAGLALEHNPLIISTLVSDATFICSNLSGSQRAAAELEMQKLAYEHPEKSARLLLQRQLLSIATTATLINRQYEEWAGQTSEVWSEDDYITAAYELAIRKPDISDKIIATQRSRISDKDRLTRFDFVSRACTSDEETLDALFESLRNAENRAVEPYACSLLYYLNHPMRDSYSAKYIYPGLEILSDVQATGDIFFPTQWAQALLGAHRSRAAYYELNRFLNDRTDYNHLLRNKILYTAYSLTWSYKRH
jgi:aminopeptidase N